MAYGRASRHGQAVSAETVALGLPVNRDDRGSSKTPRWWAVSPPTPPEVPHAKRRILARWRGTLYRSRLLHLFALLMAPAGFVAVLAGWITTETGRQPFTVYGLLRTADSASPLAAPAVGSSLAAFAIVYFTVFTAGAIYLLRLMAQPPHPGEPGPSSDVPARAAGITPAIESVAR